MVKDVVPAKNIVERKNATMPRAWLVQMVSTAPLVKLSGDMNLQTRKQHLLKKVIVILEQDAPLTNRAIHYRLKGDPLYDNYKRPEKELSELLVYARENGLISPADILDARRSVIKLPSWPSASDATEWLSLNYRQDLNKNQKIVPEIWVEKEAMANFLAEICEPYDVYVVPLVGFESVDFSLKNIQRILNRSKQGQTTRICYLGDLDPHGLMIWETVQNKLSRYPQLFHNFGYFKHNQLDCEVVRIGITAEQVKAFELPSYPLKPDFKDKYPIFWEQHHGKGYEVDVLPKEILSGLVRNWIEKTLDMDLYNKAIQKERREKKKLRDK